MDFETGESSAKYTVLILVQEKKQLKSSKIQKKTLEIRFTITLNSTLRLPNISLV
jgi:hypothetical protein